MAARILAGELILPESPPPPTAERVSRFLACRDGLEAELFDPFHDLVLRWKAGEFPCEIAAIVSNHTDLADVARGYGLKFVHIPVTGATKAEAEVS